MTKRGFILSLIFIGLITFFNSLFNGFVWDDEEQVLNNLLVHSFGNFFEFFKGSTFNTGGSGSLGGLYYKPFMTASFSLIYTIFGANPFFFHLIQVSLHIASSVFVFLVFRSFFPKKDLVAFILSLFFLVHPINAEAVVYISDLQDILYFFFGIIALWRVINFKLESVKEYIILSLLLLSSLLSKETGILFLLIISLYVFLYLRKKLLNFIISMFISVSAYSVLRFLIAGIFLNKHGLSPITIMSFPERLVSVPKLIFFYLKTFIYPADLAINQHWVVRSFGMSEFWLPFLVSIALVSLFVYAAYYFYKKNSTFFIPYLFFLIWFLAGLGMHLHIIFPLDLTVSDRWFYFPIVGLLGMLGTLLGLLNLKNTFLRKLFFVFLSMVIIIFIFRTISRNADWHDGLTLYSHDIYISKEAFDLENNLGVELFRVNRFDEAAVHFEKSTKLAPNWWTNWNNLGVIEERKNNLSVAGMYYQKAIDNGKYYLAYQNLAKIYLRQNNFTKAKQFCEQSLKELPNNAPLWEVLAISEYKLKENEKALEAAKNAYMLEQSQENAYIYSRLLNNQPLEE